jgi:DNA-binding helix-hairpin-helix protein with protein kinase domain
VSLELAALYAAQGRAADQRRLAEEMVPLFAARGVHPEARAALALYCDAARAEAAPAALAREVADYLARARNRPGVPFSPRGAARG